MAQLRARNRVGRVLGTRPSVRVLSKTVIPVACSVRNLFHLLGGELRESIGPHCAGRPRRGARISSPGYWELGMNPPVLIVWVCAG